MYVIDSHSRIESERLNNLRLHQENLRTDTSLGVHDGLIEQDGDTAQTGWPVILLSIFTGNSRIRPEDIDFEDYSSFPRKIQKCTDCYWHTWSIDRAVT